MCTALHCTRSVIIIFAELTTNKIVIMTIADISTLSRYVSPINPAVFPHLTLVLLGIGLFFTAWFFVYEVGPMICILLLSSLTSGDFYKVYPWDHEGAGDFCCSLSVHGIWHLVPTSLGWNLCLDLSVFVQSSAWSWTINSLFCLWFY